MQDKCSTSLLAVLVVAMVGGAACSKGGDPATGGTSTAQASAAQSAGASATPTEKDFCGLKFPPGAKVVEAKADGRALAVKLVSTDGFDKVESFFAGQLYSSTDQTMSNKDELRSKTWDKPSPDGNCKLTVDIKGDPTPNKVNISIVKKAE